LARLAAILALVVLGTGAGPSAAADVLVVGDSLEVGTGAHLKRELADREVEVDARTGRPSPEGLQVLRSAARPGHRVIVFDLGTNDDPSRPEVLRNSLDGALSVAGGRCLVISTLRRPPLNGVSVDALNGEIDRLASGAPNVQVADWRALTASRPSLMARDGVHATPAGYADRARLVAEAVRSCNAEPAAEPKPKPEPRPEPAPRPRRADPRRFELNLGPVGTLLTAAISRASAATAALAEATLGPPPEPVLGAEP
jgi:hypothetical protein